MYCTILSDTSTLNGVPSSNITWKSYMTSSRLLSGWQSLGMLNLGKSLEHRGVRIFVGLMYFGGGMYAYNNVFSFYYVNSYLCIFSFLPFLVMFFMVRTFLFWCIGVCMPRISLKSLVWARQNPKKAKQRKLRKRCVRSDFDLSPLLAEILFCLSKLGSEPRFLRQNPVMDQFFSQKKEPVIENDHALTYGAIYGFLLQQRSVQAVSLESLHQRNWQTTRTTQYWIISRVNQMARAPYCLRF